MTVSVTTLPAPSVPAPLLMPLPDAATDNTVGAVVSIVTAKVPEAALVLLDASVAVAVKLWVVLDSVAVVKLQAPLALVVAVPTGLRPS